MAMKDFNEEIIPEIPELDEDLLKKILAREIVIFVGNGVSRLGGVPSWKGLAHAFLKKWHEQTDTKLNFDAYQKLKTDKSDPLELLTMCESALGRDALLQELPGLLRANKEGIIRQIYGYLRDFRAGYITTNYDSFLEDTPVTDDQLGNKEADFRYKLQQNKIPLSLKRASLEDNLDFHTDKIVYLHGKVSAHKDGAGDNPIILTLSDYLEHYHKGGRGRAFLEKIEQKTFLFVGLGLKEFEIIEHIKPPIGSINKHFILLAMLAYEAEIKKHYEEYYKKLNIKLIPYNISRKGYIQLKFVLESWSQKIRLARLAEYDKLYRGQKTEEDLQKIKELNYASLE